MTLRPPSSLAWLVLGLVAFSGAGATAQIQRRDVLDAGAPHPTGRGLHSRTSAAGIPADAPAGDPDALAAALGLEETAPGPGGTRRWRHPATDMPFVFIPGGAFPMGSRHADVYMREDIRTGAIQAGLQPNQIEYELPMHEVYVSPFFLGVFEVTVAEYRGFIQDVRRRKVDPPRFPLWTRDVSLFPHLWGEKDLAFWQDDHPVAGVTWLQAWSFCTWMGGRLPTEAEWEKAARGTDERIFPWGDQFDPMRANTMESMNGMTTAVGTYPGGRSPYGCLDMSGNVWEYVLDAFDPDQYDHSRAKDPCLLERFPPVPRRVMRGGSWSGKSSFAVCRTTFRQPVDMDLQFPPVEDETQYLHIGFRVALSPDRDLYPEGFAEQVLGDG